MRHEGEASVEEILESIKKVIARDNRAGAVEQRRRRATEGVVEPAAEEDAEEVLDLGEVEYAEEVPAVDEDGDDSPLTNENLHASIRDNFAALRMLSEPGAPPQIVRSGETSLEGMVREMLRPMLAEWLDKNLPGMVERMVRDEIARIAGKRG